MKTNQPAVRYLLAAPLLALVASAMAVGDFTEKRVTCREDRNHLNPRWSIDRSPKCDARGDRLAFEVRETNPEGKPIFRLYMTTKLGRDTSPECPVGFSEPVPLSDERTITTRAQWSPVSGDLLIAQKRIHGYWQLVRIVVGGGEQLITSGNYNHMNPHWSQDGRFIVFEKKVAGSPSQIAVICANGCNETIVETPADGSDRRFPSFRWNTAGHDNSEPFRIVYEMRTGPVTDIASFRFDDLASGSGAGVEIQVTQDPQADRFPQYFDDFFLWQRLDPTVARWQIADRAASLATPLRILTGDFETGDAEADHVSPRVALNNSAKVIYTKQTPPIGENPGSSVMYRLLRPDEEPGSRARELPVLVQDAAAPQWSPNGDNVVFQKRVDGRWQIYILDSVN